MSNKNLPPVLLIEDSPDDIEFARRAFAKCNVQHPLVIAEDGDRALALLTGRGEDGKTARPLRPAVVLLDLNIPGLEGRELLRQMKGDLRLRTIPIVVLTTSVRHSDIDECYRSGANSYHQKPTDFRAYQETVRQIAHYWLSVVVGPSGDASAYELPTEPTALGASLNYCV